MSEADHHPSTPNKPSQHPPAPKPVKHGTPGPDAAELELSASGFVGMLSRRRVQEPDPLGALPPTSVPRGAMPPPTPKPVAVSAPAAQHATPPAPQHAIERTSPAPAAPPAKSPPAGWFATLMPELYLLGLLLVVAGAWGAAAIASQSLHRNVVPLVNLSDPRVHRMAYALIIGIPAGIAVILLTHRRQLRSHR